MLTLLPKNLIRPPMAGYNAWGKVIDDPERHLDLRRFDGYALTARFCSFEKNVRLASGGFLFLASKCEGSPADPRYRYRLYYARASSGEEPRDELVDVSDELSNRGHLDSVFQEVLQAGNCPVLLQQILAEDPMFASRAGYAIASNALYRAAVVCFLTLSGVCTLEGEALPGLVAADVSTNAGLSRAPEPPPRPVVPYKPGRRRRKLDCPVEPESLDEFMP